MNMKPGRTGLFVISGCSGSGKSSLLAELARRGFATAEEPGRRVVREELASGGDALPWINGIAFARRITALANLAARHRYTSRIFLAPPWPELFASDAERRHDFASAVAEYDRLATAYPALGYDVILLPKVGVAERLAFVLDRVETG